MGRDRDLGPTGRVLRSFSRTFVFQQCLAGQSRFDCRPSTLVGQPNRRTTGTDVLRQFEFPRVHGLPEAQLFLNRHRGKQREDGLEVPCRLGDGKCSQQRASHALAKLRLDLLREVIEHSRTPVRLSLAQFDTP